ncbi:MAG: hypothetical protein Q7U78_05970 [Gallionella sp.]|nr:hypothetical protein [Gallionella sp.]
MAAAEKVPQTVEGLRVLVEKSRTLSQFARIATAEALIVGLVEVVEAQQVEIEKLKGVIYGSR